MKGEGEGLYFLVSGVCKGRSPENLCHTWPWVFGPWIFYLHPCLALYHRLILVPNSQYRRRGRSLISFSLWATGISWESDCILMWQQFPPGLQVLGSPLKPGR